MMTKYDNVAKVEMDIYETSTDGHLAKRTAYAQPQSIPSSLHLKRYNTDTDDEDGNSGSNSNSESEEENSTFVTDRNLNTRSKSRARKKQKRKGKESKKQKNGEYLQHSSLPISSPMKKEQKRGIFKNEQKEKEVEKWNESSSDVFESDEWKPHYCLCHIDGGGDMIECCNNQCECEWYHFACINVSRRPAGIWYCSKCRRYPSNSRSLQAKYYECNNKLK